MVAKIALLFAGLAALVAGKDECSDSKAPCSGKSTFATLFKDLSGAASQSATSSDLALKYTDFSVSEIDAGKSWVTYLQGGKSGSCKLPIKCTDVSKMDTKVRRAAVAFVVTLRAPRRRNFARRPTPPSWGARPRHTRRRKWTRSKKRTARARRSRPIAASPASTAARGREP